MRVKTYRGTSAAAVLTQIKKELGAEAVILSNKSVREHGRCMCEIMAAVEIPAKNSTTCDVEIPTPQQKNDATPAVSAAPSGTTDRKKADKQPSAPSSTGHPAPRQAPPSAPHYDADSDWRREWNQIKGMLLGMAGQKADFTSLTPRQRQALNYLEGEGVDMRIIMSLFSCLRADTNLSVLDALAALVPTRPIGDATSYRVHVLTGPSGSGKTSCLLSLVLNIRRARPGAKICLVNADDPNGKGRLVLKHYAELSGVAYRDVFCADDLQHVTGNKRYDFVLVDTPALPRNGKVNDLLDNFGIRADAETAIHMTLSPLFAPAQCSHYLQSYCSSMTTDILWTKLDEACSFGVMVNVGESTGLPVAALSYGAGVRETATRFETMDLWKMLFKHELPASNTTAQANMAAA
jgi:flagellar biosynthesis protein FlhF